jgi:CRISPR-associated endonuclease/helicase Cas3
LLQTLGAIQRYRTWVDEFLDNPFYVSIMSATPPEGVRDVFRDTSREPDDPAHPLGRRQRAAKKANLREPVKGKGKAADEKMAKLLAKLAIEHADEVNRAIVVFCNRVATARSVHARVLASKQFRGRTTLLTGRMRPLDKDDVVQRDLAKLDSGSSHERVLEEPVIVVATQTLEVGADLDFDALVTECASLDALRQRFGRLNRAGRELTARASIVVREEQIGDTSDDPVYGAALGGTWRWLQKVAEDGEVDFGIAALDNRLPSADKLVELTVEPSLTPVMLPAHVDRWAQTWPQPRASADVSLFLHGAQRASADVQVCWRADIDLADEGTEKAALDTLSLVPPAPAECLPVPIGVLRRWLRHDDELDNSSDLEGETVPASENPAKSFSDRKIIRWRNRDDVKIAKDSRGLRPGDVCVLPATMDESFVLSDFPLGACLDIGDRANLENRGRAVLRVHDELLKKWPQTPVVVAFRDWVKRSAALYDEDPDTTRAALLDYLGAIAEELDGDSECRWMKQICGALVKDKHVKLAVHAAGGFVLRGSRRGKASREASDFGDEDDATASGTVYVPLSAHLDGVGDFAERFAKSCGLPDRLVKALRRAGELHDLGKADPRFQAMLRNGNLWARGPLLAKSSDIPRSRYRYIAAREAAGYPKGGRHELLSVRLAESADKLLPSDNLLRDLVLHLVASHHGYCRPFAPVVVDENPRDVAVDFKDCRMSYSSETHLERLDSGVSARYWRLTRHFGWWGLAWLEAILRLADHRRSEWEEMHKGQVQ